MIPSNYHTHTVFCDGKNTPEEMVLEAIRLGCEELGFSGHSYTFYDERYCMSPAGTEEYKKVIAALKEKYAHRLQIRLGIEQDYYSRTSTEGYDYVIGSVHAVFKDGCYLAVDESKELLIANVQRHYGGDYYGFIEDYYSLVGDVYHKTGCQIVGHFDLVTKFNADNALFDPEHPRYRAAANRALDALMNAPVKLEVNTGGIARGYTDQPYPAVELLTRWLQAGKQVLYASDCHNAQQLLFGCELYEQHLKKCK